MPEELEAALERVTSALPGGSEPRPGQVQMALAVAAAVERRRHLVVQAGTGTGKSLAYLVPLVLLGVRVVIATATKALQDQLAGKDLPLVEAHAGVPLSFAVLKGRANYLCRQRANEVTGGEDQLELDDSVGTLGREMAALVDWARDSPTGDRAELDVEPSPKAWAQLSVTAMECPGATRCPAGEQCFAEAARRRAADADVIVVNTHLYGTHLAGGGHVLPEHDVVVFDEAHELEDVLSAALGLELGAGRFKALVRNARPLVDAADAKALDELDGAGLRLDNALEPWRGKRLPDGLGDDVAAAVALAASRAERAVAAIRKADGDPARKARALQAGGHLVADLAFAAAVGASQVAWAEGPTHAPVLRIAPIDVGQTLAELLWNEVTAVLTSATLPPGTAERVGLPADAVDILDVGSPFPYERNAMLYCARHLPDPRTPAWEPAMHDELAALITAAGGRTLALFTSWRAMTAAAEVLAERLEWRVLTQNELPKPALIEAFRSDEQSCLFATMGFWQGIDVPGRTLSLVTIDRLPFPRPDEPLFQARRDRAGAAAFRTVDLPRAATLLSQGAGRLIRSSRDRGVVAILDPRLATAGYRWDLVRALPPMRRTRHRAEVEAFLAESIDGAVTEAAAEA